MGYRIGYYRKDVKFNSHWILMHHTPDTEGWDIRDTFTPYSVMPETIGQLMPIKDAHGAVLFYGDIVSGVRTPDNFHPGEIITSKRTEYRLVEYSNNNIMTKFELPKDISYSERSPENNIQWVLAGNKWDNPELLQSL